ncbi:MULTISPECIES: hypothetical protein [unclassified Streptomyces]|uniref:TRAFAC clade GTPase domain-containing protein n=1 Tax=unclassified Streptomyces TaxID=2593676 RepID=UPI0004C39D53
MTTVICPYCFHRAQAARLPYRCLMARTGLRGGTPCDPERDDRWASFMGATHAPAAYLKGPVFVAPRTLGGLRGPGPRAECPHCGVPTPVRVCAHCHSDLPSDYCEQDSRIIALVGAKASGKSTYVSVLVNELRHRVGQAYGAALAAMGDESQRRDREMAEDLYDRLRLPDATVPSAVGFNDPLLYRLSLPRKALGRDGSRHTALVFFDAAGEDLKSAEAMNRYTQYLSAAHGIILLVDPLQLGAVRDTLGAAEGQMPAKDIPALQIAAEIATQLRSHGHGGSRGRVGIPLAVAVTKTDTVRGLLDPHSPLLANAPHSGGRFDEADRLAVHEETRSLLEGWDSGALWRQLERDFSDVSLFGLSALGAPPPADAPADVPAAGPQPVRVEDPLLWLLARRGLLPVARPPRTPGKGVPAA